MTLAASVLLLTACGEGARPQSEVTTTTTATTSVSAPRSSVTSASSTVAEAPEEAGAAVSGSTPPASSVAPPTQRYITGCQMGLGPVETYWSDGTVTGYSAHCQSVADATRRGEAAANTPVCDGTVCRYPSGVSFPDPNAAPAVEVPYTCNYDVLCDEAGNVIPGSGGPENGVVLGNGQTCAGNGCTRPR